MRPERGKELERVYLELGHVRKIDPLQGPL